MANKQIKYRYALNDQDEIVDIKELTEADRKDYICLGCEQVLRPALGKKQKNHFRHKVAIDCSLETYLHKMGIKIFQATYLECLETGQPFLLDVPQENLCKSCPEGPCNLPPSYEAIDLTKTHNISIVEKADKILNDLFIPDILLTNVQEEKIYVEIAVTHLSSDKKIGSKIPIIEVNICKEDDFELLKSKYLQHCHEEVTLINFTPTKKIVDHLISCEKYAHNEKIKQLRKVATNGFVEIYKSALLEKTPFYIYLRVPIICNDCTEGECEVETELTSFDLTKYFTAVNESINSKSGEVDVYLSTNNGRKVFFETAESLNQRQLDKEMQVIVFDIKKDSDVEILKIGSMGPIERDVDSTSICNVYNSKLACHNFAPNPIIDHYKDKCPYYTSCFIVFASGKSFLGEKKLFEYSELCNRRDIEYLKEVDCDDNASFIDEVEKAYIGGVKIKNCYLCRYHAGANNSYKDGDGGIYCKHLKKRCTSNQATECSPYRPDKEVIGKVRYQRRERY